MATSEEFRELLFADVALLQGKAQVRDVAAALQRYWDRRETHAATVAGELARLADLDEATVAALQAEVDRLVGQARGDPRKALTLHGGLAPELEASVPGPLAEASRAATRVADDLDVPLREVAPGRYVDFLPVGEGGMGIVYWAVDSELKRQVAFKVVRPPTEGSRPGVTPPAPFGLAAPQDDTERATAFQELTARFLQEAWVTGGMEHPGIVPVYELGRTKSGVPYYTMKFVRGSRTLATALAEVHDQPLESRLELLEPFLKICDTIRYAHSRRVMHRDLKPDNIALGEFGEVVVLDWGLAKLSGEEPGDLRSRWQGSVKAFRDSTEMKTLSSAVGTPGYMAPEAAQGLTEVLDERSDVYSLGAILFEILTGRRPFAFKTFREYQEQVVDRDPPDARELDADVPEALASVCARALARARSARTPAVGDLARQVRAWQVQRTREREIEAHLAEADAALSALVDLQGEALLRQVDRATVACRRALDLDPGHPGAQRRLARADDARERGIQEREHLARRALLRKVGVVTILAALLVAGVVAFILEQRRQEAESARIEAAHARSEAVEGRAEAERVMSFMVGEMQDQLQPYGRLDLLAQLGAVARRYYENLPLAGNSTQSRRNGAIALRNLGDVYFAQGDLPAARKAYESSETVATSLVAARDAPADARYQLSLARAKVGRVLIAQGYPSRVTDLLEAHLAEMREEAGANPDSREYRGALAQAHATLGMARDQLRDAGGALEQFDQALALITQLAAEDDETGTWHREWAIRLAGTIRALVSEGRPEEALERAQQGHGIATTWRLRLPDDVRWLRVQAGTWLGLGTAYWQRLLSLDDTEGFEAARTAFDESARLYDELRAIDRTNISDLASVAFAELRRGHLLESWEVLRRQAESRRRTLAGLATDPRKDPEYAAWMKASILLPAPHWTRAHEIFGRLVEHDETNALWFHTDLELCDRMCTIASQDPATSGMVVTYRERAFSHAQVLRRNDPGNPLYGNLYAYTLYQYTLLIAARDPETALAGFVEVVEVCRKIFHHYPGGQLGVSVLSGWGAGRASVLLIARGRRPEALEVLASALDMLHESVALTDHHPHVVASLGELGIRFAETAMGMEDASRATALERVETLLTDLEAARSHRRDDPTLAKDIAGYVDQLRALRTRLTTPR